MAVTLTARERAHLKARAHALEPVVHIGHGGVTDAVVAEVERSLVAHELIKVRAGGPDREERKAAFEAICARTGATPVQTVGKVMVLWRPNPEEPAPRGMTTIEED
jgi:putative YhbY family RNA-binding protein